jgi:SAM-dependent methyltransferase
MAPKHKITASFVTALVFHGLCPAQQRIQPDKLAPEIPSPEPVVERMLEAAELKPGETVFDLGCGDGRILFLAAEKFKAKAVGVELSRRLVEHAQQRAKQRGLQDQVRLIQGNFLDVDVSSADVVTLYLLRLANEVLKPKLLKELKPGARVVSHDYEIMGWKPDRVEKITVYQRPHAIYVYRVPPKEHP